MRRPVLFASLVVVVLAIAAAITVTVGIPLLDDSSIRCAAAGSRYAGRCSTAFGTFLSLLVAGVAVAIAILWAAFMDDR
jgi:hypothetical protein